MLVETLNYYLQGRINIKTITKIKLIIVVCHFCRLQSLKQIKVVGRWDGKGVFIANFIQLIEDNVILGRPSCHTASQNALHGRRRAIYLSLPPKTKTNKNCLKTNTV